MKTTLQYALVTRGRRADVKNQFAAGASVKSWVKTALHRMERRKAAISARIDASELEVESVTMGHPCDDSGTHRLIYRDGKPIAAVARIHLEPKTAPRPKFTDLPASVTVIGARMRSRTERLLMADPFLCHEVARVATGELKNMCDRVSVSFGD